MVAGMKLPIGQLAPINTFLPSPFMTLNCQTMEHTSVLLKMHLDAAKEICQYLVCVAIFFGCTEYSIRILVGPNSRLNSVFVFGRIVLQKIHRIRIIVAMVPLLVFSCTKPRKQNLP